jgi:hypothetical protein
LFENLSSFELPKVVFKSEAAYGYFVGKIKNAKKILLFLNIAMLSYHDNTL